MKSILLVLILVGCTITEYRVKELDTTLEGKKSATGDGVLALNTKGQAIIQKERTASNELIIAQMVNAEFKRQLDNEYYDLKRCRKDMADPRLGGGYETGALPDIDDLKDPVQSEEEFGLNQDGTLMVVSKELYVHRLESERKYRTTLESLLKLTKKHREKCEEKMEVARIKADLPPKRIMGEGSLDSKGNYHETRKAEHDLNDAFELANRGHQ